MLSVRLRPIFRDAAIEWVRSTHRHLNEYPAGDLFRVALEVDGRIVAVGVAGRPCRALQNGFTVEITRIASSAPSQINACTRLYGALKRAGESLGYQRFVTYTLENETGVSPKAAGFTFDGLTMGGEWSCKSRPRKPVQQSGRKKRWIYPARTTGLWLDLECGVGQELL
jgi:hypothetical protein